MTRVPQSSTAAPTIIIFVKEPIPGKTKTRLISKLGAFNAAALADAFVLDAIVKAHSFGHPLVIAGSSENGVAHSRYFQRLARRWSATLIDQGTGGLGLRMRDALAEFIDSGSILIGTDTPSLPVGALGAAIKLLRRNPVVIGPSLDGGYYLIGVRGAMPRIFDHMPWGGARVLAATIARLQRDRVRFAYAPTWYDIDRWSDLLVLARHLDLMRTSAPDPCPATTRLLQRLGLFDSRR